MKTALITGSAKRIGLEMAKFLASKGFNIALHCNNSIQIANIEAQDITKKFGVRCEVFQCDLSNPKTASSLFASAVKSFTSVEILINNASIFQKSLFLEESIENIMQNFNIHFFSSIILCQEFAKQKIKNGLIINMLDKNTTRTKTNFFSYLYSKKALNELTRFLATELAPSIRTNSISPGFILEEEDSQVDEAYIARKFAGIPLKSKGNIKNILQAVEFFIENDYINGQNIFVDGGSFLIG